MQYSEIEAWCRLRGVRLLPWELRALVAVDRAYLQRCGELAKAEADAASGPLRGQTIASEPLTAAHFDRMFG